MAKTVTYKGIIRGLVDRHVSEVIEKRTGSFPWIVTKDIVLDDHTYDGYPMFVCPVEVNRLDFEVHGWISEYGYVSISSVQYERMRCTEKDKDGYWITESAKPFHGFVYGDALKTFKFDE